LKHYILILFLAITTLVSAQTKTAPQPKEIFDSEKINGLKAKVKTSGEINVTKVGNEFEIDVLTKDYVNEVYELATKLPLKPHTFKKGEKILLRFEAKSISSSLETGESKSMWQLKITDSHLDHSNKAVSFGEEWKEYYVAYEIAKEVQQDKFALVLQFGFPPQQFKLKNISVKVYDQKVAYASLPKTVITYAGIEADAQWRKDAIKRIEQHRQGDVEIIVQKNGKPCKDAKLDVAMVQHEFRWGVAARVSNLLNNEAEQKLLSQSFNHVVLENDLKMKFWGKNPPKKDVLNCIDQLRSKGMTVKGHALIWPGFRHLPDDYEKNQGNKKLITDNVNNHLADILSATKDKIIRWDVVNEVYTNQDLQKITGSENILFDAFKMMKQKYPTVKRNVNEFGIISHGGLNKKKQDWYYDFVKRIDAAVPNAVDGIGMQSHIGTDLTPPERVYAIIDRYAGLNKKICISEFTLDIDDPTLRQMYTEDFLIAAFSHPAIDEFLFWGYKGPSDSKVDIFNNNGAIGTMGKAYMGLVNGLWKTKYTAKTDKNGSSKSKAYFGTYECKITIGGKTTTKTFEHKKDGKSVIKIDI
jgi:endo-1,4-beta-xylanase